MSQSNEKGLQQHQVEYLMLVETRVIEVIDSRTARVIGHPDIRRQTVGWPVVRVRRLNRISEVNNYAAGRHEDIQRVDMGWATFGRLGQLRNLAPSLASLKISHCSCAC